MKRVVCLAMVALLIAGAGMPLSAQQFKQPPKPPVLTRILFVFDASQSMYGMWQNSTKFETATRLFTDLLDSLKSVKDLEVALRMYGHQKHYPPQDCDDTRLEVPFAKDNIPRIQHVLKTVLPSGTTPIAASLLKAGGDFPPCDHCRNIIILITDGIEECGGDPCAASIELQQQGIILKPFIVGIGKDFREQFECVGTYFDAANEKEFRNALNIIISRALNPTSVQVNLLDQYGEPTETNVNMTFYDNNTGRIKYNFIHSLNNKGLPDTLEIDPLITYDIVVHTIPPVRKDSVKITSGKHNVVGIDAPQGYLGYKASGNATLKYLPCLIRQKGNTEILNVQQFDQVEKYLVGEYEADILCLPRITVKNIDVRERNTTTVEIPVPGIAVIETTMNGYGSLYVEEGKDTPQHQETLYLQPGNYRVVFRSKYSNRASYSVEKSFRVDGGQTTNVKLYPY
jgi:Ca-activated chloride channel family protein